MKNNLVNVVIITYNHERYIEFCLNSIIRQKGTFILNIIINNDKSTDKTHDNILKITIMCQKLC